VRLADAALYRAKAIGRGAVAVFDTSAESGAPGRAAPVAAPPLAAADSKIGFVFQPIAALTTGRIGGFESLARWNPSGLGQIAPSTFIPAAERTGARARRRPSDDGPCPARFHAGNWTSLDRPA
jgi:predicted signal transduction protein with EAL and GGDEF domain